MVPTFTYNEGRSCTIWLAKEKISTDSEFGLVLLFCSSSSSHSYRTQSKDAAYRNAIIKSTFCLFLPVPKDFSSLNQYLNITVTLMMSCPCILHSTYTFKHSMQYKLRREFKLGKSSFLCRKGKHQSSCLSRVFQEMRG